ncbi:ABC-F family ATP-binding cassette domain-containing protein [Tetragenococcus koreensis]|uniref:ATPase component of ABC transporter with duplicated ATPase domains n=1 Tax=Tetragenococcus koreensis TaxID=290335 RepID=A0AAN4RIK5_9ENTE|nr:ABC-F family ATP-binding cassette domain-containing protein [Tetragenococcus koreensis]MDN5830923.1 ATP-binding cassette domain-containing protein [Tetragenococcus halophilus]AYW46237.1 ABC transporter ATP-binding protein [Tetragenococcus koreensis]MCF1617809.1 ATP-binding cassette domain-containing protein [Tetragenococcus koreensis]MCF1622626.1 ATP-binding cassette domain-containing protein [Tetragenococcus koreensis]MCF1643132.1 ATP-binding cassette domain-containing protein [Tetragenoco
MLKLVNISQQFGDKVLYEKLNLQVNTGEHVGLIGQNGAGKSTLIKIITGEILPDEGSVELPKNQSIGYLDQYVRVDEQLTIYEFLKTAFAKELATEAEIGNLYEEYSQTLDDLLLEKAGKLQTQLDQSDFYQMDVLIQEMSVGLGIDVLGLDTFLKNLSGGQRSKVILAKLLLEKPAVLVLDEPTNHLDDKHVQWLTSFLQSFPGTFLVVSHDQHFVNEITTHIADIEFGMLTKYTGNLDKALKQKEADQENYMKRYENQKKQIEKTESYIRKNKAGTRSKMAKSREKQLAKVDRLTPPTNQIQPDFDFPYKEIVATFAVTTQGLTIGYEKPLLKPIDLTIRYGEKVVLKGFNGIGKSTLLKTLLGRLPALAGEFYYPANTKIDYFEQELAWESPLQTPLQYLGDIFPNASHKELRRQLSRCGLRDQLAQEPLKLLSGGEQSKVKLAQLTLQTSNFLILDEPTNHIDQKTKESLQKSLGNYPGTVLVVSHEEEFYEPFIDRVIDIEKQSKQ